MTSVSRKADAQDSVQTYDEMSDKLAGPIGLLKMFLTKVSRESAEDAQMIFGGRALTQSGLGKYVEMVRALSFRSRFGPVQLSA